MIREIFPLGWFIAGDEVLSVIREPFPLGWFIAGDEAPQDGTRRQ